MEDRYDLEHACLLLASIFLVVIPFCTKQSLCVTHSDDNISR